MNDESKDNGKISYAPGPYLTSSTIWSELAENGQNEIIIESMDYGVEDWCSCPEGNGRKNENLLNEIFKNYQRKFKTHIGAILGDNVIGGVACCIERIQVCNPKKISPGPTEIQNYGGGICHKIPGNRVTVDVTKVEFKFST